MVSTLWTASHDLWENSEKVEWHGKEQMPGNRPLVIQQNAVTCDWALWDSGTFMADDLFLFLRKHCPRIDPFGSCLLPHRRSTILVPNCIPPINLSELLLPKYSSQPKKVPRVTIHHARGTNMPALHLCISVSHFLSKSISYWLSSIKRYLSKWFKSILDCNDTGFEMLVCHTKLVFQMTAVLSNDLKDVPDGSYLRSTYKFGLNELES